MCQKKITLQLFFGKVGIGFRSGVLSVQPPERGL
jgi:hypothetical protein